MDLKESNSMSGSCLVSSNNNETVHSTGSINYDQSNHHRQQHQQQNIQQNLAFHNTNSNVNNNNNNSNNSAHNQQSQANQSTATPVISLFKLKNFLYQPKFKSLLATDGKTN